MNDKAMYRVSTVLLFLTHKEMRNNKSPNKYTGRSKYG